MTEKQFAEDCTKNEETKQKNTRIFQIITMTALALFWVGYYYALYRGNDRNMSNYSIMILALTLINSDILFVGRKTEHRILKILVELNAMLVFICAVITIIQVIVK